MNFEAQMLNVWPIYLHLGSFLGVNVGKYTIHLASGKVILNALHMFKYPAKNLSKHQSHNPTLRFFWQIEPNPFGMPRSTIPRFLPIGKLHFSTEKAIELGFQKKTRFGFSLRGKVSQLTCGNTASLSEVSLANKFQFHLSKKIHSTCTSSP